MAQHYVEAGLGKRGTLLIGALQTLGGIGLIVFRFQKIAGLVVSTVMLVAIFNNFVNNHFPAFALTVLIFTLLPTLYLYWKKNNQIFQIFFLSLSRFRNPVRHVVEN